MKYYPVNLRIKNRKVLVFGGGEVALRKTLLLLEAGAYVKVVSKEFLPRFSKLAGKELITLLQAGFSPLQINDFFLVFAATDNRAVNTAIAMEATRKNILVNDCSNPDNSSFINTAIWQKNDLVMTCSTEGNDPKLAREVRQYCQESCEVLSFKKKDSLSQ